MSLERIKYLMYKDLIIESDAGIRPSAQTMNTLNAYSTKGADKLSSTMGDYIHHANAFDKRLDDLDRRKGFTGDSEGDENSIMFDGEDFLEKCTHVPNQEKVLMFFNAFKEAERKTKDRNFRDGDIKVKLNRFYVVLTSLGGSVYRSEGNHFIFTFNETPEGCKVVSIELLYLRNRNNEKVVIDFYEFLRKEPNTIKIGASIDETNNLITFK